MPAASMPTNGENDPSLLAAFQEAIQAEGLIVAQRVDRPFTDGVKRVAHRTAVATGALAAVAFLSYVLVPALMLAAIALQVFGLAGCSVYALSCASRAAWYRLSCTWRGEAIPSDAEDDVVAESTFQKTATEHFADFEYRVVIGGTTREDDRTEADRLVRMDQLRDNVARAAYGL